MGPPGDTIATSVPVSQKKTGRYSLADFRQMLTDFKNYSFTVGLGSKVSI